MQVTIRVGSTGKMPPFTRLRACTLPATTSTWVLALRPASGTPAHTFDWTSARFNLPFAFDLSGCSPPLAYLRLVRITAAGVETLHDVSQGGEAPPIPSIYIGSLRA